MHGPLYTNALLQQEIYFSLGSATVATGSVHPARPALSLSQGKSSPLKVYVGSSGKLPIG